jgi:hypothetical protein
MNPSISLFRNYAAEAGIELTLEEAEKFYKAYIALKEEIAEAVEQCPDFYQELCNRTTEQKVEDIQRMNNMGAGGMTLKDYQEIQKMVKKICELEGYA